MCFYEASLRRTLVRLNFIQQSCTMLRKVILYKCATQEKHHSSNTAWCIIFNFPNVVLIKCRQDACLKTTLPNQL